MSLKIFDYFKKEISEMLSPHHDKVFLEEMCVGKFISFLHPKSPQGLMSQQSGGYFSHSLVDLLFAKLSSRCRGHNGGGAIPAQPGRRIEIDMNI